MSLQTLSEWLRCPNCFSPLTPAGGLVLRCTAGHSFDANRRGYVSLLGGRSHVVGDNAAMLDARTAFLEAGWYDDLRTALTTLVAAEDPTRVLDIGCGTGYYLRGVTDACPEAAALGMDLSPVAVARTVAGSRQGHAAVADVSLPEPAQAVQVAQVAQVDGLVADVWADLPVRTGVADVLLNVFAPRNPAEFHRVLRDDGLLAVVVPHDDHLRELRDAGLTLDIPPNKAEDLRVALEPWFALETLIGVSGRHRLGAGDVAAVIGMGPSAHHTGTETIADRWPETRPVTFSFDVLGFRRRPVPLLPR
ncbi:methyltransferase domain-containing protein [Cryobacterium algoricola]|uniref:Methyltransferase domain-containing protein n=1 Tax=Cryobacterium algoricola TaxID=1259183 RepID=A0ABY2IHS6_9MICO|nr:methyltransferase domain-containing protein [Cryobacterium algoricola]TFB90221.1 methyltransferase domain-containing protein [Cryobacterium algoricola]